MEESSSSNNSSSAPSPLFSLKGLFVVGAILTVVFVLTRALGPGGSNLGLVGTLLPLSVALLLGGMLLQALVHCPTLLTDWRGAGFFSACLFAATACAQYAHYELFGLRL